jgi:Periplasmic binding protein/Major Facilitator Superfamily
MSTATLSPCDGNLALATAARPYRYPTATLAASILSSGLAFIDGSVINVALAAIDRDLHPGPEVLAWLINAYLLAPALVPLGGAAGDHYGRRRLFLIGIGLFLAASLVCAAAPTLPIMLTGRAVQGIGAARR